MRTRPMGEGLAGGAAGPGQDRTDRGEARGHAHRQMSDHEVGPGDQEAEEDLRVQGRAPPGRDLGSAKAPAEPGGGRPDRG